MINLSETDFRVKVPRLSKEQLEEYSVKLFDEWELHLTNNLNLSDYSLHLQVEDGSIKGKYKILVGASALYMAIGQYGSFISGVKEINNQIKQGSNFLNEQIRARHEQKQFSSRRKQGALEQIEMLFIEVQKNDITVEDATEEVKRILGEEINDIPHFEKEIKTSITELPRQTDFDLDIELIEPSISSDNKPAPKKTPPNQPSPAIAIRNCIEIWRDEKKVKKTQKKPNLNKAR